MALLAPPEPDYAAYEPDERLLGLGLKSDRDDEDEEWKPPNHRGRSRFGAIPGALKAAVTCVVIMAFLLLADRFAVMYAQDKAEDQLKKSMKLATAPEVDIHGFPFLTQVFAKRLERVDVAVPDVDADRVSIAEVRATARDVSIVGDLPSSLQGAVIGSVEGDVLLSFDDLNRELGASQAKFRRDGDDRINISGELPILGAKVLISAEAHVGRDGDRAVTTTVDRMRVDLPGIVTYRPGKDRATSGLRLHPQAAEALARQGERIKAMLAVPAVVERLGVPQEWVGKALRSDAELHRLTGSPQFVKQLMGLNLVDVVSEHPWLLEKVGIDPKLIASLLAMRPPELSERLSMSFRLPAAPAELRLREIKVEPEGIRADLGGSGLTFGDVAAGA
ncbi:LmeA family phospholipid-binding protein [Streptomyces sp. CA-294286]|uniref:LmeA family phospholipid-binding protein n=1 Tax=Streptomyces sp. CA-294286 TaxID=3240070 RepID=UPI003D8DE428